MARPKNREGLTAAMVRSALDYNPETGTFIWHRLRARKDSASGLLGVKEHRGKFDARIHVAGKAMCLGAFATPAEAHAAYIAAKREFHEGGTL